SLSVASLQPTISIEDKAPRKSSQRERGSHSRRNSIDRSSSHSHRTLVEQVQHWILREREKQAQKKAKKALRKSEKASGIFKHRRHHEHAADKTHPEAARHAEGDLVSPPSPTTSTSSGTDDISPT